MYSACGKTWIGEAEAECYGLNVCPSISHGCESWTIKKAEHRCFWTVVLEKTLESPLDSKEIKPVNPNGNQSWIFIIRTDAEAEVPILWPPDVKNWLIWKNPHAGEDWGQEEKGTTEDQMVGWHVPQWTWVWVDSRSWWWTGRSGVLQFMGSQRVRHNWVTELNCITVILEKGWKKGRIIQNPTT